MPTSTTHEGELLEQLNSSIDPDAVWLKQVADFIQLTACSKPALVYPTVVRMRRIATKLLIVMQDKKINEGPKCQWCGDPMHKGTCPTISAMDYEYSDTGVPRTRRVEFFDKRRVTQNMSPEVVVVTKKQE